MQWIHRAWRVVTRGLCRTRFAGFYSYLFVPPDNGRLERRPGLRREPRGTVCGRHRYPRLSAPRMLMKTHDACANTDLRLTHLTTTTALAMRSLRTTGKLLLHHCALQYPDSNLKIVSR